MNMSLHSSAGRYATAATAAADNVDDSDEDDQETSQLVFTFHINHVTIWQYTVSHKQDIWF